MKVSSSQAVGLQTVCSETTKEAEVAGNIDSVNRYFVVAVAHGQRHVTGGTVDNQGFRPIVDRRVVRSRDDEPTRRVLGDLNLIVDAIARDLRQEVLTEENMDEVQAAFDLVSRLTERFDALAKAPTEGAA